MTATYTEICKEIATFVKAKPGATTNEIMENIAPRMTPNRLVAAEAIRQANRRFGVIRMQGYRWYPKGGN